VPAIGFIDGKFDVASSQQSGGRLAAAVGVTDVSDAAMATGLRAAEQCPPASDGSGRHGGRAVWSDARGTNRTASLYLTSVPEILGPLSRRVNLHVALGVLIRLG